MPPTAPEGFWVAIGALLTAAAQQVGRVFTRRKSKADQIAEERARLDAAWARLDEERRKLLAEVRDELDECRKRADELEAQIQVEKFRVALLIRALQEAGIPVPDAAILHVDFDAATGSYKMRDVA